METEVVRKVGTGFVLVISEEVNKVKITFSDGRYVEITEDRVEVNGQDLLDTKSVFFGG